MGHPKKAKKSYERPFRPYDRGRIEKEKKLMQSFGLHRKHEIWRAQAVLRTFRQRARDLQAAHDETKAQILFARLNKLGITCTKLEDILSVQLEDLLSRRLQSIIFRKGFAQSQKHARQLIVHGHIRINRRKVLWPSYLVPKDFEEKIELSLQQKPVVAA